MKEVALVTGSSRGIGRGIALELARAGYAVCVNYVEQQAAAEETAAEIRRLGGEAIVVQADVADGEAVRRMVAETEREFGAVTLLVNNAGLSWQGLFQEMDDALWQRLFDVNVTGARNAIQAVLPQMLARQQGNIVNISSMWGLRGASCEVAYACTKAALVGLTRSLAMELAPSGIRVNAVAPGCIDTDMMAVLGEETRQMLVEETPLGRLGTPEDIARAVRFLASEQASFFTGQILTADGGFTV